MPPPRYAAHRGFTLLEMIVVLLLVGILAVTAGTRFMGTGGVAEYSWQKRLLATLRLVQQQAMQDTRVRNGNGMALCHLVNFTFSPPQYGQPAGRTGCGAGIDFFLPEYSRSGTTGLAGDNISLAVTDNQTGALTSIGFNGLGQPVDKDRSRICLQGCTLTLSHQVSTRICIEAEGYIHDC